VTEARREIGRPGRQRWLTGRRAPGENWDVFEAPPGEPLVGPGDHPWAVVKGWLMDLANELAAADRDGTLPPLDPTRVWIRRDGRALLLDFAAPGAHARPHEDEPVTPVALLGGVARRALGPALARGAPAAAPPPLPLSAAALIERWSRGAPAGISEARRDLSAVVEAPDTVLRWRRAVPIGAASVPIVVLILGAFMAVPLFFAAVSPERMEMYALLDALDESPGAPEAAATDAERLAIEVYLAGRYGAVLRDARVWDGAWTGSSLRRLSGVAARVADAHPAVAPAAFDEARSAIAPRLQRIRERYADGVASALPRAAAGIVVMLAAISLAAACLVTLISAALTPGGILFRALGLAVVSADGRAITRGRSVARVLLAWSPAIVWLVWLGPSPIDRVRAAAISPLVPAAVTLAVLAAGAIWTIARRSRGPHDVLTGTWVVPR
jgi:hypothetical protein